MTSTDFTARGTTGYFSTSRLRVRPFAATDVEAFLAYRSDPDVARYQSWSDDIFK